MKALCLLLLLAIPGLAQNSASVYGRISPSTGAGSGTGYGIGFDIYSDLGPRFAFDIDLSYQWEPKTYVGDGFTFRAAGVGLVRVAGPFLVGGGIQAGRTSTSAYTKNQAIPLVSVHFNPSRAIDLYGEWLFRDRATFDNGRGNNTRGFRAGWKGVFPLSEGWGVYTRVEYTRFWFEQLPGYPNAGTHSGNAVLIGTGFSKLWKANGH